MKITRLTRSATLAGAARRISDGLRAAHPRATVRLLTAGSIADGLAEHQTTIRAARADDVVATTTIRGGYVRPGYGYRGEADEVLVTTTIATGQTTIHADRVTAHRRDGGAGPLAICRLRREGQSLGRVVR